METSANLAEGGDRGIGGFLTFADRAVRSHLSCGSIPASYQLLVAGCKPATSSHRLLAVNW
ncbi:hypothetical protein QT971_26200 [Microcoleus sp. herbarium19]|uniref:hypothetical protein n=1 Tax=unclassified Microcoleus TaxID=2642155 RepID=UPI002FD38A2F